MTRFFMKTLGCKVNTFDSHVIQNQLKSSGLEQVFDVAEADVTIINTCSVTAAAEKEARYLARKIRRDFPQQFLAFTGCYAQTDSASLAQLKEIDLILPNEIKDSASAELLKALELKKNGQLVDKIPSSVTPVEENRQEHFKSSVTFFDVASSTQTRAFVKIQDGCNGFCTYCLIPYARGASRSVPAAKALAEIGRLVQEGVQEIVLTGIHIGDYGRDFSSGDDDPFALFLADAFKISGLQRLRISSLEPSEVTASLLQVLGQYREHFCPHFHLPLQSGSDRILKKMRRSYAVCEYRDAVSQIRKVFPEACFGADVIPGFPGETEEDHRETVALVKSLPIHYLHVFPYSLRPNTAAAKMPGHLPAETVKRRAAELRTLSQQMWSAYKLQTVGKTVEVLWEKSFDQSGRRLGRTREYVEVVANGIAEQALLSVSTIKGVTPEGYLFAGTGASL